MLTITDDEESGNHRGVMYAWFSLALFTASVVGHFLSVGLGLHSHRLHVLYVTRRAPPPPWWLASDVVFIATVLPLGVAAASFFLAYMAVRGETKWLGMGVLLLEVLAFLVILMFEPVF
jgi:hypothetical protein